jgi:hypothetical protein
MVSGPSRRRIAGVRSGLMSGGRRVLECWVDQARENTRAPENFRKCLSRMTKSERGLVV